MSHECPNECRCNANVKMPLSKQSLDSAVADLQARGRKVELLSVGAGKAVYVQTGEKVKGPSVLLHIECAAGEAPTSVIEAIKAGLGAPQNPPVNVDLLLTAGGSMDDPVGCGVIQGKLEQLGLDCVLTLADSGTAGEDCVVTLGHKGLLELELIASGTLKDVGCTLDRIVLNPAWNLVWALATLKDAEGRTSIEGFSDDVLPVTRVELEPVADYPFDTFSELDACGLRAFVDDVIGTEALRRTLFWPGCTISGIEGGYTGPGSKTIMPSEARARVCFSLIPNQAADAVYDKVLAHLAKQGFSDIAVSRRSAIEPWHTSISNRWTQQVLCAAAEVTGKVPAVLPWSPACGSGWEALVSRKLGVPAAAVSWGVSKAGADQSSLARFVQNFLAKCRLA